MKYKLYIFVISVLALLAAPIAANVHADAEANLEYQIKAAFLYNFIKFVDWPEKNVPDSNEPIILGIIGDDPFGDALDPVKDKYIKGRKVLIERFEGLEEPEKSDTSNKIELQRKIRALRKCNLLFVCSSENKNLEQILKALDGSPVLTVGETADFLDAGGVIKFSMENQKVCFEINSAAAEKTGLKIRAQLLRLAKKVVKENAVSVKKQK